MRDAIITVRVSYISGFSVRVPGGSPASTGFGADPDPVFYCVRPALFAASALDLWLERQKRISTLRAIPAVRNQSAVVRAHRQFTPVLERDDVARLMMAGALERVIS